MLSFFVRPIPFVQIDLQRINQQRPTNFRLLKYICRKEDVQIIKTIQMKPVYNIFFFVSTKLTTDLFFVSFARHHSFIY